MLREDVAVGVPPFSELLHVVVGWLPTVDDLARRTALEVITASTARELSGGGATIEVVAVNGWSPEVRITVDRNLDGDGVDLTLSYPLTGGQDRLLWELYDAENRPGVIECRMHDDDPRLRRYRHADGRVHGAWLLLARWPGQPGRLLLKHWPGGIVAGSHAVPSRMTAEHRHRQEYIAARGASCGYAVELEKKLVTGFRPDVVVAGAAATMAAEVQMVPITPASLTRRANGAAAAGLESVWFPGVAARTYAFKVAHVETNERFGMAPRQWTVTTGPRTLMRERCTPSARQPCRSRRSGWCGKWHPIWEPMHGLVVDDVVEQVPSGALVRLDTGRRQGVILTRPTDRDDYLAEFDMPTPRSPQPGEHRTTPNHAAYPADRLARRLLLDRQHDQPAHGSAVDSDGVGVEDARPPAAADRTALEVVGGGPYTVLERFLAAGISRTSFAAHLAAGRVRVNGRRVTDPDTPAPRPCTIVLVL